MGIIGGPRRSSVAHLPQRDEKGQPLPRRMNERRLKKLQDMRAQALLQKKMSEEVVRSSSAAAEERPTPLTKKSTLPPMSTTTLVAKQGTERATKTPKSAQRSSRSRAATPETLPVDWRTLAACEVVLDHEEERRKKAKAAEQLKVMREELDSQLQGNQRRRANEREEKVKWMNELKAQARRAKEEEEKEKQALKERRLRDRAVFAQQAQEAASRRDEERRKRDAEDRKLVDAAQKSLQVERDLVTVRLEESKRAQVRLKREIEAERKLKMERQQAEWRENERIIKEANERQEEIERRRQQVMKQREDRMAKFQNSFASGAGKKMADDEARAVALAEHYQQLKQEADDDLERAKRAKRAQSIAAINAENSFQLEQRKKERRDRADATARDLQTAREEAEQIKRDEDRKKALALEKQAQLQALLEEQAKLIQQRKAAERVQMSSVELALNRDRVVNILADDSRKSELKSLLNPKKRSTLLKAAAKK